MPQDPISERQLDWHLALSADLFIVVDGESRIVALREDGSELPVEISQRLHGASIGVELAIRGMGTNPDGATERLQDVQEQLDQIADDARNISLE